MRKILSRSQTRAGYSEPSCPMSLVGLCDDVIGHEFPPIGLRDPLLQIGPFLIAQDMNAGAPCLDLARVLGKLVLILLGPRGDLLEESLGSWAHVGNIRPNHRLCQSVR